MLIKYSVFVVLFCITLARGDVSHLPQAVDQSTIDVLHKNITDYLVHLGNDGSPQMQLKQIFGASKQVVTGTVYTVQALLDTAEGPKNCEIRVLEQAWFDFCQVRVSCENGAQYEVTLNQHIHAHQEPLQPYKPQPVQPQYVQPQPAFNLPAAPQPPKPPQPQYKPPVTTTSKPFVYQFPTRPQEQPKFTQPITRPPFVPPPQPQPVPVSKPERPVYNVQPERHEKPYGVPHPIIPPAPALNILPLDKQPQGDAFQSYLRELFNEFMVKYNRQYIDVPGEREYRFSVFTDNFYDMNEHARADQLACQYSVTEFSDLTGEEFSRILGFDTDGLKGLGNITDASADDDSSLGGSGGNKTLSKGQCPEKYDQRDEKIVTRVKLQGDCGACWAFTTVAVIEGLCAKRTKKLQEFSEQSLLDCDNSNYGCKGGFSPNAIKHIAKRGGLELESSYPYLFAKSKCHFDPKTVRVKVDSPVSFKKGDEEGMKNWLCKNGPILVGINSAPLKYYKGGVLNPTPALCNPKKIDHGVTLIGYGVEKTSSGEKLPYWIVKNSWGSRWGEDGFFRIARGKNACGIALWAYSAKLSDVPNNCLLPDGK